MGCQNLVDPCGASGWRGICVGVGGPSRQHECLWWEWVFLCVCEAVKCVCVEVWGGVRMCSAPPRSLCALCAPTLSLSLHPALSLSASAASSAHSTRSHYTRSFSILPTPVAPHPPPTSTHPSRSYFTENTG